jgi:serine/threonine-protein kinase
MPTGLATPSEAHAALRRIPSSAPVGRLSSATAPGEGFAPGAVLAERYRIIGLIGRGGMGEVYRADDLKLAQAVALKFLPERLAFDASFIERFYAEVRHARQVSHPNVCRVYDIGEIEGRHYLSMEYVDGEDLASLLRRIGRLGQDKALEIARQLCAGLAAAHDKGVLHRDLKPANVMIDGRGRARITDFGLAVGTEETAAEGEVSGTPAYMAPEQLAGRPATAQSDIYALGLVLYELFAGKKAFEATTLADWRRKHSQEPPPAPSAAVRDMDPIIERVILRCLEKEPRERPRSALSIAVALPGGDPLAAALAAGETPSPEMVAAAGEPGGMKPALAWSCLVAVLLGLALVVLLSPRVGLHGHVPLEKSSGALEERSREILRKLGYPGKPADTATAFVPYDDYLRYVEENDRSPERWRDMADGRPAGVLFGYRQSPEALVPKDFFTGAPFNGLVTSTDPPMIRSGMASVVLDPLGRLVRFEMVPPQLEPGAGSSAASADWAPLFSEAGLDATRFASAPPRWTPPSYADSRVAWQETHPEGNFPLRVEAASFRGKPVFFELLGPWSRPDRMRPARETPARQAGEMVSLGILLALLLGGILIARRNVRLGRGDRRGAFRLALFVFSALMLGWCFAASHVLGLQEFSLFLMMTAFALLWSGLTWVLYIALEPFVRRRWPETIISWSRLLAGRFRDPRIGRDLLIGASVGVGAGLLFQVSHLVRNALEAAPPRPTFVFLFPLMGPRLVMDDLLFSMAISLFFAIGTFFLLFLLRLLLRKELLAAAACVLLLTFEESAGGTLLAALFVGLGYIVSVFVLVRFGVLALAFAFLFEHYTYFPLTPDLSAWYAGTVLVPLLILAGLAVYGFRTALAGRPVFGALKLEE